MTIICFDGKTLAADKRACSGDTASTVTKIFRDKDFMVGIYGDLTTGMEMLAWLRNSAEPLDFPESAKSQDGSAAAGMVLVQPDGSVVEFYGSPYPIQIEGKFCAFGSGAEAAMVAMSMGATAAMAVEMVCLYNITCGNGINVMHMKSHKPTTESAHEHLH